MIAVVAIAVMMVLTRRVLVGWPEAEAAIGHQWGSRTLRARQLKLVEEMKPMARYVGASV